MITILAHSYQPFWRHLPALQSLTNRLGSRDFLLVTWQWVVPRSNWFCDISVRSFAATSNRRSVRLGWIYRARSATKNRSNVTKCCLSYADASQRSWVCPVVSVALSKRSRLWWSPPWIDLERIVDRDWTNHFCAKHRG